jgi:hypothetical protein
MRHPRRLCLGSIGVAVLTIRMIVSGCGTASTLAAG